LAEGVLDFWPTGHGDGLFVADGGHVQDVLEEVDLAGKGGVDRAFADGASGPAALDRAPEIRAGDPCPPSGDARHSSAS
jgi:hypothetical protein